MPCGQPQGVLASPSDPEDRFMSGNLSFDEVIYNYSGAPTTNLLPTGDDDHRVMLPAIIVFSEPSPQVLIEISNVYWIHAHGGVTSEDRYIDSDGVVYRIFKNCNRSDNYAFLAIKES